MDFKNVSSKEDIRMNIIERYFYLLAENNEQCDSWLAQWKLAKKRAPMILDVISHVFPHYSLHNASHSEAILNNISIILGKETIEKLSVVDLWLLLNAAYYHDCGMMVDSDDKKNLFADGSAFVKFVKENQDDQTSPMHEYAQALEIKDDKIYYANNALTAKSYEAVRFLMADFVRKAHAERSTARIEEEFIGNFPSGMIPKRIVGQLSQICAAHTQMREKVMNLPFEQTSGCGTEPCHPRFVAFLLRLGDLLDVDNNRISDVLLHSLGSIPVDSKDYNEINRSITLLNITKKTIEISADCHNYKIAELTNDWFKWLNDEVVFVSQHWYDIVPNSEYGSLPTVGKLEVNLIGYDTIDGKNRPEFKIDTGKALELIQGAGLYTDPAKCMRELLQNAVDATHLRAFVEHPDNKNYRMFFERLKNYPISVSIKERRIDDDHSECSIKIEDQGLGMSKEDLKYLFNTGSSYMNRSKRKIVEQMDDFMRPSGIFGIGFQSVFLIADEVVLRTRKLNNDDTFIVEMKNPIGAGKGAILMKTLKNDDTHVGTTVEFKTQKSSIGDQLSPLKCNVKGSMQFYKEFDLARKNDSDFSYFVGLIEELYKFAQASTVPLILEYNNDKYDIHSHGILEYYDEKEGIAIELIEKRDSEYYFRNQLMAMGLMSFPSISFAINILEGDAKHWLKLNRESYLDSVKNELSAKVKRTVARYLMYKKIGCEQSLDQRISMVLDYLKPSIEQSKDLKGRVTYSDSWKQYPLKYSTADRKQHQVTIGEILSAPEIVYSRDKSTFNANFLKFTVDGQDVILGKRSAFYSEMVFDFVVAKISQAFSSIRYVKGNYVLNNTPTDEYVADDKDSQILMLYNYKNHHTFARDYFPCNSKYAALRISQDYTFYPFSVKVPAMVCPYKRVFGSGKYDNAIRLVYDVDDEIIDNVYNRRHDQSVTKEQIKTAYEQFAQDYEYAVGYVNSGK